MTHLERSTVTVVWLTYLLAGTAVAAASWFHVWELDISEVIGWVIGSAMIAGGIALLSMAVVRFDGIEQLSGLEVGELVTSGVYQWSRNPQNPGLLITFAGAGIRRGDTPTLTSEDQVMSSYWERIDMSLLGQ